LTDAYNDNDPGACAWLRELIARNLIPKGEVLEASILNLRPSDLAGFRRVHFFAGIGGWPYALRLAGIRDDDPRRIWTGSPPCQPFSPAGKGLSKDDPRHLAPHFIRLVGACRPELLYGEQVASAEVFGKAASGAGKRLASAPQWAWLDDLSDRLEAARYAIGASYIPAAGIGAPHIRQRTFFGAVDLDLLADASSDGPPPGLPEAAGRHARDAEVAGDSGRGRVGPGARRPSHDGMADADGQRHDRLDALLREEEPGRDARDTPQTAGHGQAHRPDPLDGFWRGADWLWCRDGKWRPVEPGLEPLADGLPARVVRLRGYGNAIVPQVAAEFVRAFEEAQWSLTAEALAAKLKERKA
jgi:DNA (cytosine-5)-methyltransferase 1